MDNLYAVLIVMALGCCSTLTTADSENTSPFKENRKSRNRRNDYCELEIHCHGQPEVEVGQVRTSGGQNEATEVMGPVTLPIRGPRGRQGPPGEKGERGSDGISGQPGLPGLSAPAPKKIAFFVGLSNNMGPVTDHTDIVFDQIITNIGAAYDEQSGRFTAPVAGTYQFNVVVSAQGRQKAAVMILKNGGMVATVWAESIPYWATASNIAVLSLEKGDQVWLLLLNRASYLHGYMYSTFSGFMIFEN